MRRSALLTASAALSLIASLPAAAEDLTIDALHSPEGLSGPSLRGAAFSPDGSLITILRGREDAASTLDLWAYDAETGAAEVLVRSDALTGDGELSEEEKNRRERQRIYDTGIISYQWDDAGERLLFPIGGDVFLYDLAAKEPLRVTETEAFETDPKMSPEGSYVSFVRDDELVIYDVARAREKTITKGATETIRNAVAEFVAQEELDRDTGYWWSPDESLLVYTQIDESPVDIVERLDFGADGTQTIRQRYPFAGTDNVKIRLGMVKPTGGKTTWIDLGDNEDIYVADVVFNGTTPYVLRLSRDQKTLDVLSVDVKSGKTEIVFTETSETWLNLLGGFNPLSDGFLWTSEREGMSQVYRYDAAGELVGRVTDGVGVVGAVSCVNEEADTLFYTGWRDTATERHVYRQPLSGGDVTPVTSAAGWHSARFGEGCGSMIHSFSSPNQPTQTGVADASGNLRFWLLENALDEDHPYAPYLDSHRPWQWGQIEAEDGQMMDYALLLPEDAASRGELPAIQMVYGGPGVQRVAKSWYGGKLEAQLWADKGYVVFMMDNRGATNRGKAFEDVLYRAMGQSEVRDQATGTEWLVEQGYVDPTKIGVKGWSYGGYMTLMMLAQEPDLYAAGVAGAPVSDWKTYDTAYTERFMGDPRQVPEAYAASSVLTYADGIQDDTLLMIHGMADDNVIFQNAIDVMAALQAMGTDFDLMTYPGEKHGFRDRANRIHRDELSFDFLDARLTD